MATAEPASTITTAAPMARTQPVRAAALLVGQTGRRCKTSAIETVAHHRHRMTIATVFPRHRHTAIAGDSQRRPPLLVNRCSSLYWLREAYAQRSGSGRQRCHNDAVETPSLLGPCGIEIACAKGQRDLRGFSFCQFDRSAARHDPRMHPTRFFPRRHKTPRTQGHHDRLVTLGLAQADFRPEFFSHRGLDRQVTLRAAIAVVFPYHAHGIARHRYALAVGRFQMRKNLCALNRVGSQRLAPCPRGLRRPRQRCQD